MQPTDLQQIGPELAIKWDDGRESFIPLEELRRACPCAGCMGERDIMGTLHKGPAQPLSLVISFRRVAKVGGYAIQPVWGDGHASGIFSFEYCAASLGRRLRRRLSLAAERHEIVDVQKLEPGADIFTFRRRLGMKAVKISAGIQVGRDALFLRRGPGGNFDRAIFGWRGTRSNPASPRRFCPSPVAFSIAGRRCRQS